MNTATAKALVIPMTRASFSTNVHSHGYDVATRTLRIKFLSGSTYQYENVPPEVASGLHSNKSIGAYVALNIKGKYPTKMLEEKPARRPDPEPDFLAGIRPQAPGPADGACEACQ